MIYNFTEFMIQNKLLSLTIGVFRSFIVSSFQEYTSLKRSLPYSTHINNIILCDTVNLTTLFQLVTISFYLYFKIFKYMYLIFLNMSFNKINDTYIYTSIKQPYMEPNTDF